MDKRPEEVRHIGIMVITCDEQSCPGEYAHRLVCVEP